VTACFTSASVSNGFPIMCLLSCPMRCKSLDPILPLDLWLVAVLRVGSLGHPPYSSALAPSTSLDPVSTTSLASGLRQTPTWSKSHFLFTGTWHWFLLCWVQALVWPWNKCLMSLVTARSRILIKVHYTLKCKLRGSVVCLRMCLIPWV
jgi:hypothetical protein